MFVLYLWNIQKSSFTSRQNSLADVFMKLTGYIKHLSLKPISFIDHVFVL